MELPRFLQTKPIAEREASFCLLDQRTFECCWSTVEEIANYKKAGRKIEIFYFLANAWLDRALSATKEKERIRQWWGGGDWERFRKSKPYDRAQLVCDRFRTEFKYSSAQFYPIFARKGGAKIMYFMVHATDHPDAPRLMWRAYHKAVTPLERYEQLKLGPTNPPSQRRTA